MQVLITKWQKVEGRKHRKKEGNEFDVRLGNSSLITLISTVVESILIIRQAKSRIHQIQEDKLTNKTRAIR